MLRTHISRTCIFYSSKSRYKSIEKDLASFITFSDINFRNFPWHQIYPLRWLNGWDVWINFFNVVLLKLVRAVAEWVRLYGRATQYQLFVCFWCTDRFEIELDMHRNDICDGLPVLGLVHSDIVYRSEHLLTKKLFYRPLPLLCWRRNQATLSGLVSCLGVLLPRVDYPRHAWLQTMPTCEGDQCRSKKRAVERDDGRKLCDPCESQRQREQQSDDDGTSASNGNIITDADQIVNEMLTYCLFHQKNSSSSAIKRVVMDFYTPE